MEHDKMANCITGSEQTFSTTERCSVSSPGSCRFAQFFGASLYGWFTATLRVILLILFQKAQCFLCFRWHLHQYWPVFPRGLRVKNQNHTMFIRVLTGLRLQTPKRPPRG